MSSGRSGGLISTPATGSTAMNKKMPVPLPRRRLARVTLNRLAPKSNHIAASVFPCELTAIAVPYNRMKTELLTMTGRSPEKSKSA